jgi:uncharacterized membrane protein YjjP (DUF1212 family)
MKEYLQYLPRLENWLHVILGIIYGAIAYYLNTLSPVVSACFTGCAVVHIRELSQRQMKVKLTTDATTAHFFNNWFDWSKKQQMELYPTLAIAGVIILCMSLF